MNKRKIDINELKKGACKGKKYRTINVKYETVLSYFKQKEVKEIPIFQLTFPPLILDLIEQLTAAQFVFKLENKLKQPIKPVLITSSIKLETFQLKNLSKEYPVQQICDCLYIQKDQKTGKNVLEISKSKLMIFFKNLRLIYSDFCYCTGEKYILESNDLKNLYETFKVQWMKNQEKGRLSEVQKLEKKICRSLYFVGIIIENNIFDAIDESQRKKKEEMSEFGTKSEHKKNIKGINQQVSSTYSFGSMEFVSSNFSTRLKSQKSNEEDFNERIKFVDYSEKSEKIVSKSKYDLWDKAEIKTLKFNLYPEDEESNELENQKYEINYLSNDVENILIQQAFKIQKFKDSCDRYEVNSSMNVSPANQYCFVNYNNYANNLTNNNSSYNNYLSYMPYSGMDMNQNSMYAQGNNIYSHNEYPASSNNVNNSESELMGLKRSLGCLNLVETRKNNNSRYK